MSEFRFFSFTDYEYFTNRSQSTFFSLPISRFEATTTTTISTGGNEISTELNIPYTVFEILVAIFAIIGNLMVIIVFQRERKLRRRTNYYIVSLAMADFLVGSLGVPFAVMASIGLPTNLYACLFTVSLLVVLCTISIFCLVAVSVDRYWAILYPMAYSRNVRTKTAIIIISMCWVAGTIVGFLPLFGWHADVGPDQKCLFVEVMDYNYLVFLYFATIITPALLMLAFYTHIYRVIVKQVRQIVTMNPMGGDSSRRSSTSQIQTTEQRSRSGHGGTMLRVLGASRKRDVKATQNLSIIVLFFMICWFPLYTINCIKAFCPHCFVHPKLTFFCIILSHLNSAGNPVLYAYHLKDFRAALKNLILKIMGIEVEPQVEAIHRFSLASQHRLQSMDATLRNPLQQRIYIDSPVWLRQQQQQALKNSQLVPKCGVVTPCLNNIHQTVAAVASLPTDIEREMWNIMEASSGAERADVTYDFGEETKTTEQQLNVPSPPPRLKQLSSNATSVVRCGSPYSYDNCNYSVSADEAEFDEVFLPSQADHQADCEMAKSQETHSTIIACGLRAKLRSDDTDYQTKIHSCRRALTDSSYSDYELSKRVDGESPLIRPIKRNKFLKRTPSLSPPRKHGKDMLRNVNSMCESFSQSSSSTYLANSAIYVIDNDIRLPVSPAENERLGRAPPHRLAKLTTKTTSRSCSCTSDSSSLTKEMPLLATHNTFGNTTAMHSDSNSISSLSTIGGSGDGSGGGGCFRQRQHHNNNTANNSNSSANGSLSKNANTNNVDNNNSHAKNNLNYYTFYHNHHHHHPHPTQTHILEPPKHFRHIHHRKHHTYVLQSATDTEKFSPLKVMSNFIFPPIVKHSSLFQIFQQQISPASESSTAIPAVATSTATISTTTTTTTQTSATNTTTVTQAATIQPPQLSTALPDPIANYVASTKLLTDSTPASKSLMTTAANS